MEIVIEVVLAIAALLAVDFVSGFVHWAEDTFGTEETPVVGRWIVAPNVLHHLDGGAFLKRGWFASNWDLGLAGLLIAGVAWWLGRLDAAVVVFAVGGAFANQIHKWNHAASRAPLVVRGLWATGVLQRPAHHAGHHGGGKNTHYCVVTPFVNPVLDRLRFWRGLERVLVPVFGAPRREDLAGVSWNRLGRAVGGRAPARLRGPGRSVRSPLPGAFPGEGPGGNDRSGPGARSR